MFKHFIGALVQLIDEDGNVLLVLAEVEENHTYSCSIINEIAENCTSCQESFGALAIEMHFFTFSIKNTLQFK